MKSYLMGQNIDVEFFVNMFWAQNMFSDPEYYPLDGGLQPKSVEAFDIHLVFWYILYISLEYFLLISLIHLL